jgi:hypothetical protein
MTLKSSSTECERLIYGFLFEVLRRGIQLPRVLPYTKRHGKKERGTFDTYCSYRAGRNGRCAGFTGIALLCSPASHEATVERSKGKPVTRRT